MKDTTREPGSYELMVLGGMQNRPMYQGTASATKVAKRRAKNKLAKASRKTNRGSNRGR